jgi:hypothetical protein
LRSKRQRTQNANAQCHHDATPHPIFLAVGFAALICCAVLVAGFVHVLGYTPGTITGPRLTSAVTHVPTDETIGHR